MCVTVLQWKCSLAILKWRNVKTWTTLSTVFTFFWHDTSKNAKSRVFLDFEKRKKRILELWWLVDRHEGRAQLVTAWRCASSSAARQGYGYNGSACWPVLGHLWGSFIGSSDVRCSPRADQLQQTVLIGTVLCCERSHNDFKIQIEIITCDNIYAIAPICYRLSVRLSVCLSDGWIIQKRLKLGLRLFHHTIAPSGHPSSFCSVRFIQKFWGVPPDPERGRQTREGWVKSAVVYLKAWISRKR